MRELVGDSYREGEKERKSQSVKRVVDKRREGDRLVEEETARRERHSDGALWDGKRKTMAERVGEAEMDARWLKRDDERSRKWTRRRDAVVNRMKEERRKVRAEAGQRRSDGE